MRTILADFVSSVPRRIHTSICNQLFAEPRDRVDSRRDLCLSCKVEQSTLEIQYYSIESYIRRVLLIPAYSQCCSKEFIEHRMQVVFLRAKSQQAIQFASGNRMVELPNLKAKNIIFLRNVRDIGEPNIIHPPRRELSCSMHTNCTSDFN
jgi:hypothetical protein